jgi:ubiquinone/menaquinone biosynthesis C-methylase UbiE
MQGKVSQMAALDLADFARAEVADLLDLQLSPLGMVAINALDPQPGQTILDIGCGAGQTLLQLAGRVGPSGRVIGIDIAPRVLDIARSRTTGFGQIHLVRADAAALDLPNEAVDAVFSRFGVMALDDPFAAFSNFHRMTRRGGRLSFVCWRSLEENDLDLIPFQAAGLDVPIDKTPFKFERRDYLMNILQSTGFREIEIQAFDTEVSSGNLAAMMAVLTKVGVLGKLLRETPNLYSQVEPKVRAALKARVSDGQVSLKAATWIVTAEV